MASNWVSYLQKTSLLLLALFLFYNMVGGSSADKEIPQVSKFGHSVGGPTMAFFYCYSCGYRKAFEDYVNILGEKYPHIRVVGDNYNPSITNIYLSKAVFCMKLAFIILLLSKYDIFAALGQQSPSWWRHLMDNKLYACTMIFLVGNMLEGQLISSGAFEITLNDVPVWSKLQTGRIPAPQELFQIIDNQLQFSESLRDENPNFLK